MVFDKVTYIMLDVRIGCNFLSFPNSQTSWDLFPGLMKRGKGQGHVEQVAWRGALPIDGGVSQPEVTL